MCRCLCRRTILVLFVLAITLPGYAAPDSLTRPDRPWWCEIVEVIEGWVESGARAVAAASVGATVDTDEPIPEATNGPVPTAPQMASGTEAHPDLDPNG